MTLQDVAVAITFYNVGLPKDRQLSTRNPANFFKDFIRNRNSANLNWPPYVREMGYTARQVTGAGNCFEFVPILEGKEPFEAPTNISPSPETPRHVIESLSMPLASRELGRDDEPWLIQVVARLRIVETHFAVYSGRKTLQVDLLQLNVKLNKTEIDALYLVHEEAENGELRSIIVTCEAKRGRDDILEEQILRQAKAPFGMRRVRQDLVVPMAVKCVGPSEVFVVEFNQLERANAQDVDSLSVASTAVYRIEPPVPGLCQSTR